MAIHIFFFRNSPTGEFLRAMAQTTQSRSRLCLLGIKKFEIII